MLLTVDREVRCAACGGRIKPNTEVDYLHAAGEFKPEYRHLKCPEKKMKTVGPSLRAVPDPEEWLDWANCAQCQTLWTVHKAIGAGAGWVGPCCTRVAA